MQNRVEGTLSAQAVIYYLIKMYGLDLWWLFQKLGSSGIKLGEGLVEVEWIAPVKETGSEIRFSNKQADKNALWCAHASLTWLSNNQMVTSYHVSFCFKTQLN